MEDLFLVIPNPNPSKDLNNMINKFCENFSKVTKIANSDNLLNLKNKKILFAIEVGFFWYRLIYVVFSREFKN